MTDELLKAICRLLNRNDVMPHEEAMEDLDNVLGHIDDQGNYADRTAAIQEIRTAVQVIQVSQPGAYL